MNDNEKMIEACQDFISHINDLWQESLKMAEDYEIVFKFKNKKTGKYFDFAGQDKEFTGYKGYFQDVFNCKHVLHKISEKTSANGIYTKESIIMNAMIKHLFNKIEDFGNQIIEEVKTFDKWKDE